MHWQRRNPGAVRMIVACLVPVLSLGGCAGILPLYLIEPVGRHLQRDAEALEAKKGQIAWLRENDPDGYAKYKARLKKSLIIGGVAALSSIVLYTSGDPELEGVGLLVAVGGLVALWAGGNIDRYIRAAEAKRSAFLLYPGGCSLALRF